MTFDLPSNYEQFWFTTINRDLRTVVHETRKSLNSRTPHMYMEREGELSFASIYSSRPEPSGRALKRVAFYEPATGDRMTVMFASPSDGWRTLGLAISRNLNSRLNRFAISRAGCQWPIFLFEAIECGQLARHVSLIKDVDKWRFLESGSPVPGEDVSSYRRARVSDRLSESLIASTASALGCDVGNPRFWTTRRSAKYFEQLNRTT